MYEGMLVFHSSDEHKFGCVDSLLKYGLLNRVQVSSSSNPHSYPLNLWITGRCREIGLIVFEKRTCDRMGRYLVSSCLG